MWTGLVCFTAGTSGGLLGTSWLDSRLAAAHLAASRVVVSAIELS